MYILLLLEKKELDSYDSYIWQGKDLDFQEGKIILIDKPLGWTSFDVVKKIRFHVKKKLNLRKIKVGHAGTLDPLATGLLIVCTGRFTKRINELMGLEKVYSGTIKIGSTTPSFDLESDIDHEFPVDHITDEKITMAAQSLTGPLDQIPPIFSAIKVNGKRAYKLARKGEEVELKPKPITVHKFQADSTDFPNVSFIINCSKGTYIRSLARDLGLELDSGAHLTELRRDEIGSFKTENAHSVDSFISLLNQIG